MVYTPERPRVKKKTLKQELPLPMEIPETAVLNMSHPDLLRLTRPSKDISSGLHL